MRRNWVTRPADERAVSNVAQGLGLPLRVARLLVQRGVATPSRAEEFLFADLGCLAPPERMKDLPQAAALIQQAVSRREKILVVGDYDTDGLTGAALLVQTIRVLGGDVDCHIPNRLEDGYGLKEAIVRKAARSGVKLLISVDCGTHSFEEIRLANFLGLGTVVVDHHDLGGGPPAEACALLNPLRLDCNYPDKGLASVGVAFTLARRLLGPGPALWAHLDLVALGTVADMAPLTGENRVLVRAGLHTLGGTRRPGLRAMLARAGLAGGPLTPEDVSFSLAPPLNAMGRMGSAEASFRLLTAEDPKEAVELAGIVFRQNRARAAAGRAAFQKALSKVAREVNFSRDRVIVLEDESWHPGLLGILAAQLAGRFHRPTVVIGPNGDGRRRGSARSIPSFHLVEALQAVKEHLMEFGGHPAAAGLSMDTARIPAFRQALNQVAHERLDARALTPTVDLDGELPLSDLTEDLIRDLEALGPFGMGNPRPVFASRDARISSGPAAAAVGFSRFGIRFKVESPAGHSFDALHPRQNLWDGLNPRRLQGEVHLAYSPVRRKNGGGGGGIELRLQDLRLAVGLSADN